MGSVMDDKEEECEGCVDYGHSYGTWPCTHCSRAVGGLYPDSYKEAKDSPVSSALNEAFKNV